ncbi:MAG: hypothetical protein ACJ759_24530 [Thermoanaerobaculia bacterium]
MKRLLSPKVCAALVMIAWLAALVSSWGMSAAGARAIGKDTSCSAGDLENVGIRLEMASSLGEVPAILAGKPPSAEKAACIRRGETAVVRADTFFLISYSLLALALFLFVRALRAASGKPSLQGLLLALGVLLALTMAIGDLVENRHLTELLQLGGQNPPPSDQIHGQLTGLKTAAYVKMGALALASLILGALWPSRSRWVLALRFFGFAAAALFVGSMVLDLRQEMLDISGFQLHDWNAAVRGMIAFAAFALAALIHAIATVADRKPYSEGAKS